MFRLPVERMIGGANRVRGRHRPVMSIGSNNPPPRMGATTAFGWAFHEELTSMKALTKVRRFLLSEDGPTAVEYAVMLALILVACITIVTTLGTSVSGTFSRVNASMSS